MQPYICQFERVGVMCCGFSANIYILKYYLYMNKESHQESAKEIIEKLTNIELAYGLAMLLNHKYDFGGYSVGRSERSFLLGLFFRLNQGKTSKLVQDINPFDNGELFLAEIAKREEQIKSGEQKVNSKSKLDLNDKRIFSAIVLRFWIKHYEEEVVKNNQIESVIDKDFSFEGEIKRARTLYNLYLSDLNIDERILDSEGEVYIEPASQKYTNAFRWHVDDLCNNDDENLEN